MMHHDAELRFISERIGCGLFAKRRIPRGTITWTADELDQRFTEAQMGRMAQVCQEQVRRFAYVNSEGIHVLCWDHGRYVNHSCEPNCLSSGFDFEFAIRDIEVGEQICDDYGLMNPDEEMQCLCGNANCRGSIGPEDLESNADRWDELVRTAFPFIGKVEQPLWPLVAEKREIEAVLRGEAAAPSCRAHGRRLVVDC